MARRLVARRHDVIERFGWRPAPDAFWGSGAPSIRSRLRAVHQTGEVERFAAGKADDPVAARPLTWLAVPGQLDAIEIGIVQINGLMRAVIGGPIDAPAAIQEPLERRGQVFARRVQDAKVIKAGGAFGGRLAAGALPGVQAQVMVVAPGREKGRLIPNPGSQVETHQVMIEVDRPVDFGDPQVDVPDLRASGDGGLGHGKWAPVG